MLVGTLLAGIAVQARGDRKAYEGQPCTVELHPRTCPFL